MMAMKPNYKRQRTERSRVKRIKAEEKEKEKAMQVAQRRAEPTETDNAEAEPSGG
jgi:hypothetical protein